MKAIHMREHGGPGVLKFEDVGDPGDPGPGEVVVHDSEGAKRPDGEPL